MINWKHVQAQLHLSPDGLAGKDTYTALLAYAAQRPADAIIRAMGEALATHAQAYGMTTAERLSEFIAQICNETGGFRRFVENLYYKLATTIKGCWPKRFLTLESARPFVGNPEALANRVYGGRGGNTQEGDGWRFRGRGALQLTFRNNYRHYGELLGLDLEGHPELAEDPTTSVLIALQFFQIGQVNVAVDRGDFRTARRITNGGAIGLEEVARIRTRLLELFH